MKQIQTNKNPDENPDLPIDFEMFDEKKSANKSLRLLSNVCEQQKVMLDFGKVIHRQAHGKSRVQPLDFDSL